MHFVLHFTGSKEAGIEEKAKGSAQKAPVVQRGRFSVTSDDVDLEVIKLQFRALGYPNI